MSQPLDATKYVADPCLSLSPAHLTQLGATSTGRRVDLGRDSVNGCSWKFEQTGATSADVGYPVQQNDGLTNQYKLNAVGFYSDGYFEPTEFNGYPAAYADFVDQRKSGSCGLFVGLSDHKLSQILVVDRPGQDSCKAAKNVALAVLDTIKGSQ